MSGLGLQEEAAVVAAAAYCLPGSPFLNRPSWPSWVQA
jgi:hypothetical protein